jgi:aldehyde decarbonylase
MLQWRKESLNDLIEEAILDAEVKGVKVLSLGLLNQASKSSFLILIIMIKTETTLILKKYWKY